MVYSAPSSYWAIDDRKQFCRQEQLRNKIGIRLILSHRHYQSACVLQLTLEPATNTSRHGRSLGSVRTSPPAPTRTFPMVTSIRLPPLGPFACGSATTPRSYGRGTLRMVSSPKTS